jgi:hypothetical protein
MLKHPMSQTLQRLALYALPQLLHPHQHLHLLVAQIAL